MDRKDEIQSYIYVLRGLISYHERMVAPIKMNDLECQKTERCPAVAFADDVYLETLKESLKLMEKELLEIGG